MTKNTHDGGNPRLMLVGASLLVLVTVVMAPLLGRFLTSLPAMLSLCVLYWTGCWGLVLRAAPPITLRALYSTPVNRRPLEFTLTWLPPFGTLVAVFINAAPHISVHVLAAVAAVACINGVTEELFWRGGFVATFPDNFRFALLYPTALFTAWHVALALIPGIRYEGGGTLALVGSAALMGLAWGWVAWRTGDLRSVSIAHVLTNVFAFTGLVLWNWVG